ncbi:MAG TPA: hypothetical protein VF169_09380 [Albitalea sp.]|uniref:hypothetical protein n=1 Tax=Piscinibacter sp. TaxID=1903157 RepID=UPI002ED6A68C
MSDASSSLPGDGASSMVEVPGNAAATQPQIPNAPAGLAFIEQLRPRSAYWRARKLELQLSAFHVAGLESIHAGVTQVAEKVGGVQLPAALQVTTQSAPEDRAIAQQGADALVDIAEAANRSQGGECSALPTLSNLAFALIARLTTLTAHLMDMHEVTLESVLEKLHGDVGLRDELERRLEAVNLHPAAQALHSALDPARFEALKNATSEELFAELNECAATLLAIKCQIATTLRDGSAPGEWPPDDGVVLKQARNAGRKRAR